MGAGCRAQCNLRRVLCVVCCVPCVVGCAVCSVHEVVGSVPCRYPDSVSLFSPRLTEVITGTWSSVATCVGGRAGEGKRTRRAARYRRVREHVVQPRAPEPHRGDGERREEVRQEGGDVCGQVVPCVTGHR